MTEQESDIKFVRVPWGVGQQALEAGVSEAPPEDLYGARFGGESKPEGDPPTDAYRASQGARGRELVRCPAREFIAEEDDLGQPLVGQTDDTLLSSGGTLLMYGKGGAGKTTLTIDAICHLASGTPWLGQLVTVPLKIILIENEGRKAALRKRLRARHDNWEGEPWVQGLELMTDPWMGFSFRDEWCRQGLAEWITEFEADLVVVGPLVTIGAIGGGTPEEVYGFEQLLIDTRNRTVLDPAFWIIHHENKAGDVSGAWDRMPDTMLHVSGQGNGHTRLHFRKARESSLHDTSVNLSWDGTFSFTIDDPSPTDEDVLTRVRSLYEEDDQWRTVDDVREAVQAGKAPTIRAMETLADSHWLHDQMGGVPGRSSRAHFWCHDPTHADNQYAEQQELDSATRLPLDSRLVKPESSESSGGTRGSEVEELDSGPTPPPYREGSGQSSSETRQNKPKGKATPKSSESSDNDIPF